MCKIERTLRRGGSTPHARFHKGKVEGHKFQIQQMIGVLAAPSSSLDENSVVQSTIPTVPDHSGNTATTTPAESGTYPAPPSPILYEILIVP